MCNLFLRAKELSDPRVPDMLVQSLSKLPNRSYLESVQQKRRSEKPDIARRIHLYICLQEPYTCQNDSTQQSYDANSGKRNYVQLHHV